MKTFSVLVLKVVNARNNFPRHIVAAVNEAEASQAALRRSGGGVVKGIVRI